jgi:hypothetical protein
MSDEGFHEIQLNGKQLVFLFMAATVVSVVIFLLGVMVGRGIPSARTQAAEITDETLADPTAAVQVPAAAPGADRVPVSAQELLTYAQRLAAPTPSQEAVRDVPAPPVETPPPPARETAGSSPVKDRVTAPIAPPAAAARGRSAAPAPVAEQAGAAQKPQPAAGFAEPAGDGHVVQVGAYPPATAETIARRLESKGYPVFIAPRPQGLFAVRVGKYRDRREAETVAGRLEKQEQFNKPWVTR